MALPVWPSTLPQAGVIDNMSGGPQSNAVSFKPQNGPTIDRKKSSSVARNRKMQTAPMTKAQYATFKTFFETTLAYGVLPFTWTDGFTGATGVRMKFIQNDPVYNEVMLTSDLIQIDFEVLMY